MTPGDVDLTQATAMLGTISESLKQLIGSLSNVAPKNTEEEDFFKTRPNPIKPPTIPDPTKVLKSLFKSQLFTANITAGKTIFHAQARLLDQIKNLLSRSSRDAKASLKKNQNPFEIVEEEFSTGGIFDDLLHETIRGNDLLNQLVRKFTSFKSEPFSDSKALLTRAKERDLEPKQNKKMLQGLAEMIAKIPGMNRDIHGNIRVPGMSEEGKFSNGNMLGDMLFNFGPVAILRNLLSGAFHVGLFGLAAFSIKNLVEAIWGNFSSILEPYLPHGLVTFFKTVGSIMDKFQTWLGKLWKQIQTTGMTMLPWFEKVGKTLETFAGMFGDEEALAKKKDLLTKQLEILNNKGASPKEINAKQREIDDTNPWLFLWGKIKDQLVGFGDIIKNALGPTFDKFVTDIGANMNSWGKSFSQGFMPNAIDTIAKAMPTYKSANKIMNWWDKLTNTPEAQDHTVAGRLAHLNLSPPFRNKTTDQTDIVELLKLLNWTGLTDWESQQLDAHPDQKGKIYREAVDRLTLIQKRIKEDSIQLNNDQIQQFDVMRKALINETSSPVPTKTSQVDPANNGGIQGGLIAANATVASGQAIVGILQTVVQFLQQGNEATMSLHGAIASNNTPASMNLGRSEPLQMRT